MNEMLSPKADRNPKDLTYRLRFITIHNGQGGGVPGKQTKQKGKKKQAQIQSHYLAYLCNFATSFVSAIAGALSPSFATLLPRAKLI
jgi:hypothetical protein